MGSQRASKVPADLVAPGGTCDPGPDARPPHTHGWSGRFAKSCRSVWLPCALCAVWCASVAGMLLAHELRGAPGPTTCWFKSATGLPCATCGGTRTFALLLDARLGDAFSLNPMVAGLIVLTPAGLVAWWALSRRERHAGRAFAKSRWPSRAAWTLIALLGANWVYVLVARG